jgi:hypothetical protein
MWDKVVQDQGNSLDVSLVWHGFIGGIMKKEILFDYQTNSMMEVVIPVTKKHTIVLMIRDTWLAQSSTGLYPPSLRIKCGVNDVTNYYIKQNADQEIKPTADNIKTAIDLIEEAEWRMSQRGEDKHGEEEKE